MVGNGALRWFGRRCPCTRCAASTAFLSILVLGAVLLAKKCALEKRFDRWFAAGLAVLAVTFVASSLLAKTQAWDHFATVLLR